MKYLTAFLIACALTGSARAQNEPVSEEEQQAAIEAAMEAAGSWLTLMSEGKVALTWENASAVFKESVSQQEWVSSIKQVRDPLGPFGERTHTSSEYHASLPQAPPGPYVILTYDLEATAIEKVIETLAMRNESGEWKPIGYYINQPE